MLRLEKRVDGPVPQPISAKLPAKKRMPDLAGLLCESGRAAKDVVPNSVGVVDLSEGGIVRPIRKPRLWQRLNAKLCIYRGTYLSQFRSLMFSADYVPKLTHVYYSSTLRGSISVSDLAELIDEKPVSIIKLLMTDLGVMASMTQNLDHSTCIAVVEGFGKIVGGAEDMDEEL